MSLRSPNSKSNGDDEATSLNLLTRFGLSKDEAALFVLMSRINKEGTNWLKGTDISSISNKGRVRTYQILQRLVEMGVAKVDLSRPKRYSTVSPQVALRRLLSLEESKLTELSRLERNAVESLLALKPIDVAAIVGKEQVRTGSVVSLLQGLANIQVALREAMEGSELSISVNEESADHIFSTLKYLPTRPKSVRMIFSTLGKSFPKASYPSLREMREIDLWWRAGHSPTFILSREVAMFPYYTTTSVKRKPLSPVTTSITVSQLCLITSSDYTNQMNSIFELMLKNSRRVN
ncbi:MAG TPA: helix-turn-helix domain-containing protein [Nitrososphaerales archaeon]|nr:helix-turn-helix domain-containing protein [Nitrososphaerales archaeon]